MRRYFIMNSIYAVSIKIPGKNLYSGYFNIDFSAE